MKLTALSPILATIVLAFALAMSQPAGAQSAESSFEPDSFIRISRSVLPAVVNITIEPKDREQDPDQLAEEIRRFFMERRDGDLPFFGQVSGSGVMIDRRDNLGYVLTNNHVVAPLSDHNEIKLTFHLREDGGTNYNQTTIVSGEGVRVIGRDQLSDLAVVEFLIPDSLDHVTPLEFADSDKAEVGEFVLALGNPLNFNHTVTHGIISGKSRFLGSQISLEDLIQTDVVIQQGNSGGPLVNLDGKIVGINNAIVSRTGLWQGTSFAIPSNDARRVSEQLIEKGHVTRGYLGIRMRNVSMMRNRVADYQIEQPTGVWVDQVVPNSPADVAGVHVRDVILDVDGISIRDSDHMLRVITSKPINEDIRLKVVRLTDSREPLEMEVVARLTERPNETMLAEMHQQADEQQIVPRLSEGEEAEGRYLGMQLSEEDGRNGLKVESVERRSKAAVAGVRAGDTLTHVNGRAVRTLSDLGTAIARGSEDRAVIRGRREGGTAYTFEIELND